MKTTNKDILFSIIVIAWLLTSTLMYYFYKLVGVMASNILYICVFCILIYFNFTNKKFINWLKKPFQLKKHELN